MALFAPKNPGRTYEIPCGGDLKWCWQPEARTGAALGMELETGTSSN